MKKDYQIPNMEIRLISDSDIVATSGERDGGTQDINFPGA